MGRAGKIPVTVSVGRAARDVVVERRGEVDPAAVRTAVADLAEGADLVVERTGTPVLGAIVGDDLLAGDRLVDAGARRRPRLIGVSGPLRATSAVLDRELSLGRGSSYGDRIVTDPAMSREHLRLSPVPGAAIADDLGSTNGTTINGQPLTGPLTLQSGDLIGVGDSELLVLGDPPRGQQLRVDQGFASMKTSPAAPPPAPRVELDLAPPPPEPARERFIGRRTAEREHLEAERRWLATSRAEVGLLWQRSLEWVAWAQEVWPSTAVVAASVAGWSERLWSRQAGHPGFLTIRAGTSSERLPIEGVVAPRTAYPRDVAAAIDAAATQPGVPSTVDLQAHHVVALVGPSAVTAEHAAAWLLQLAALHSPDDVGLGVVSGRQAPIARLADSCRWLPHVARDVPGLPTSTWFRDDGTGAGALLTHLEALAEGTGSEQDGWLVVAVDVTAAHPDQIGAITTAARHAPCTVVWLAPTAAQRPEGCSTTIELSATGHAVRRDRSDDGAGEVERVLEVDLLEAGLVADLARTLAPLVDAGHTAMAKTLPDAVSLTDALGIRSISEVAVESLWARPHRGHVALPLGESRTGLVNAPFPYELPHGYVVGPPDTGVSTFLHTVLCGAALSNPPNRLTVALISTSSRSPLLRYGALPHRVGIGSGFDHDPALGDRFLVSLEREVQRRQELLDQTGAERFDDRWAPGDRGAPPRLLVVIDDATALAVQVPSFLDRLVDLVVRGGAPGISVLAGSQHLDDLPEALRQASGLRVATHAATTADSVAAIGRDGAERTSIADRSVAFVAVGSRPAVECRLALPTRDGNLAASGRSIAVHDLGAPGGEAETSDGIAVALHEDLLPAVRAAATYVLPDQVVMPPLPDRIESLPATACALADHPERPDQQPYVVDLDRIGTGVVLGPAGSGVTNTLAQVVAASLAQSTDGDLTVLVAADRLPEWAAVRAHPRCAGVIDHANRSELHDLLSRVEQIIDSRLTRVGDAPVLVVVDDAHRAGGDERAALGRAIADRIVALAERGPASGVHLLTGFHRPTQLTERLLVHAGLSLSLPSSGPDPSDVATYAAAEPTRTSRRLPPGRAIDGAGTELQVMAPERAEERFAATHDRGSLHPLAVSPLRSLPTTMTLAELPLPEVGRDVVPIAVNRSGVGTGPAAGRPFLVCGEAGSGRSNALAVLLHQAHQIDPTRRLVLVSPQPTLAELDLPLLVLDEAEEADRVLTDLHSARSLVVVDGLEDLRDAGTTWEPVRRTLLTMVRGGSIGGTWVAGSALAATVRGALHGESTDRLVGAFVAGRSILVLRPAIEVLSAVDSTTGPLGPGATSPAGRAALVTGRPWTTVHVPSHPGLADEGRW